MLIFQFVDVMHKIKGSASKIPTCECLEEPVTHIHSLVAAESELWAEAVKVLQRLGGHVVEVAEMTHL